jgi:hypothetical protein
MKKLFGLTLVLVVCMLVGRAKPVHATCLDNCLGEFNSCKLDCRFNPYPGCLTDCNNEYNACKAAC